MNSSETLFLILGAATTVILGVLTMAGLGVKFILLPYLRDELVAPIQETRNAVTVNGGTSEVPTVLDKIEHVAQEVRESRAEIRESRTEAVGFAREALAEVAALSHMFDGHLEWSQDEVDRLAEQIREAKRIAEHAHTKVDEHEHEPRYQDGG